VAGSPIDDSETIVSTAASSGTTFAIPAERLDQTRMPPLVQHTGEEEQRAPVEMPWLIITSSAPCTLWSVSAPDAEHHETEVRPPTSKRSAS